MAGTHQLSLFGNEPNAEAVTQPATPAAIWEKNVTKRALDELFTLTRQYRATESYRDLLQFVARFRFYSPFNAMLIHIQMPGAKYVAPPHRWLRDYGRRIKAGVRPLVILQPMGPVMFVFDVSDTEPTKDAGPLPREVERPFEVRKGRVGGELRSVSGNARRDGVRVVNSPEGSQSAGSIRRAAEGTELSQKFQTSLDKNLNPVFVDVPIWYDLIVNVKLSMEAQYATVVHELAHLYCGHLGTPDDRWWPDRRGLKRDVLEFEAESVAYLVCSRLGIDNPSEQYLSGYMGKQEQVPSISLECIMKSAGLIETMSRQRMKLRQPGKEK